MTDDSVPGARESLYPELAFGGYSRRDGTVAFYTRVASLTTSESRVLDFGCGSGAHIAALPPAVRRVQQLKGRVREVVGSDLDTSCAENPFIDRFVPIKEGAVQLEAASVDVCVADWVLEHVRDIDGFFGECERVIRPEGYLCIRTPNRYHYSSLGARIVPFRYHQSIRRWLGQFHGSQDVFPTYYACNTRSAITGQLLRHGFTPLVYAHRGDSHLAGVGRIAGLFGETAEYLSPPFLWHELHAFGRRQ